MVTKNCHPIPPPESLNLCRQHLVGYWNNVAFREDLVGVPGSLVRDTEIRITELLEDGSLEAIYQAMRLTVEFECSVVRS